MQVARVQHSNPNGGTLIRKPEKRQIPNRISKLQSPILLLSGHEGEIFTCQFSPMGDLLATGSFDKSILLWDVYGKECKSTRIMKGHDNAVLDIKWLPGGDLICSASADKTIALWDCESGGRIKRFKGHQSVVNSVAVSNSERYGPTLLVSGGDDGNINIWDIRQKSATGTLEMEGPVTSVAVVAGQIFAGSTDNLITAWDLKTMSKSFEMAGHLDSITGLTVSMDENYLLSNSLDNNLRLWDARPFSTVPNRQLGLYLGAPHSFDKYLIKPCFSPDAKYIAAGSGDRSVVVWDRISSELLYKLPGHKGTVIQVDWHPSEPIVVSCAADRQIFMGEIELD